MNKNTIYTSDPINWTFYNDIKDLGYKVVGGAFNKKMTLISSVTTVGLKKDNFNVTNPTLSNIPSVAKKQVADLYARGFSAVVNCSLTYDREDLKKCIHSYLAWYNKN